jgi:hypothetical protein
MAPLVLLSRLYEHAHELGSGVLENAVMISDRFLFVSFGVLLCCSNRMSKIVLV